MRSLRLCVLSAVVALAMVWAARVTVSRAAGERARAWHNVKVVLLARTPQVKVGQDIVLWLAVHNRGKKPVRVEGRMPWGNLGVRYPGSGGDQFAETRHGTIAFPREDEMVDVQPGCFYGRELLIGGEYKVGLIEPLRKLRRGSYTFYAAYTNYHPAQTDQQYEWGKSNKVSVRVE